jgi:hypothetical protein
MAKDYGAKTGIARVLKPLLGFEDVFEGLSAVRYMDSTGALKTSEKIPFFEWTSGQSPNPLDPLAASGTAGYAPDLLAYVDVSKGATLRFFFPSIDPFGQSGATAIPAYYRYFICFRDSTLARYKALERRGEVSPYHIPFESFGQADTTAAPGSQERFLFPAGVHSVAIHELEPPRFDPAKVPGSTGGPGEPSTGIANALSLRTEVVIPRPELVFPVLIAAGTRGVHQQGVLNPATAYAPNDATSAGGMYFECVAEGDQLLICCDREYTGLEVSGGSVFNSPNWSFSGLDAQFSDVYGTASLTATPHDVIPETGIYLWETTTS